MKKTAEKATVRRGWVILSVFFFFCAQLLGMSVKDIDAVTARQMQYDLLTRSDASFLSQLQDFLSQNPERTEKGNDAQIRERMRAFSCENVLKDPPSLRISLLADGVVVWNNWQDTDTGSAQLADVDVFDDNLPQWKTDLNADGTVSTDKNKNPFWQLKCVPVLAANANDVYARLLQARQFLSKDVNRPMLLTEYLFFLTLTTVFAFFALRDVLREGRRTRNTPRDLDAFPPDLYFVCVLPSAAFLIWRISPYGHVSQSLLSAAGAVRWASVRAALLLGSESLCSALLFLLLLTGGLLLTFSLRRGGLLYAFAFFRYEKVPFVRRTIYYLLCMQGIKFLSLSLLLSGRILPSQGQFVLLLVFLLPEKLVTLPILLRCVREMRGVMDTTARYAQGDLSEASDEKALYRSVALHRQDVESIARRIRDAAEDADSSEEIRAGLIANLSRDVRAPLTSVCNYTQLLRDPRLDPADKKRYLQALAQQTDHLSKLVEDLTDISDAAAGNIHAEIAGTDLCLLVRQEALRFEEQLAKRGILMRFYMPSDPVYVQADARLLRRVADNLMHNICKYAKEDSFVKIAVVDRKQTAVAVFHNTSEIHLSDLSGKELMERFVRGDVSDRTDGSGSGLSIARSLLDLQGGSLTLHTDKDLFTAQVLLRK